MIARLLRWILFKIERPLTMEQLESKYKKSGRPTPEEIMAAQDRLAKKMPTRPGRVFAASDDPVVGACWEGMRDCLRASGSNEHWINDIVPLRIEKGDIVLLARTRLHAEVFFGALQKQSQDILVVLNKHGVRNTKIEWAQS